MQDVTHTLTGLPGLGKVEASSLRGLLLWFSRVAKGLPTNFLDTSYAILPSSSDKQPVFFC